MGSRPLSTTAFVVFQLVVAVIVAGLALPVVRESARRRDVPQLRARPLVIAPRYDRPNLVSMAELQSLLARLHLPQELARTDLSHLDHALRLWGPRAAVPDKEHFSGALMLRILLEHDFWAAVYGREQPPLLQDDGDAVRYRALEGAASSPHVDHTVATLLEAGVALDARIRTPARETTLRTIVETSLRDFSLYQREAEWSALVFALTVRSSESWLTRDRQRIDFDRLAARLMLARPTEGVGFGQHRLFTLAAFLNLDEQLHQENRPTLLSPDARAAVTAFLKNATDQLVRSQHATGFWNGFWAGAALESSASRRELEESLTDRILVTGHALEWWAIVPEEILPTDATLHRAARWLVETSSQLSQQELLDNYSYLTHVGRALAWWRGLEPSAVPDRETPVPADLDKSGEHY